MKTIFFRVFALILMVIAYPLSLVLPAETGWENGVIENTQVIILVLGILLTLNGCIKAYLSRWRWFLVIVLFIWLLLIGREWSWGATILVDPLWIHPEMGPVYTSMQLSYKNIVYLFLTGVFLLCLIIFIFTQQYKSILILFYTSAFPWKDVLIAAIAAALCTFAEKGSFLWGDLLSSGGLQILEELFELSVYLACLNAEIFVYTRLKKSEDHFLLK